MYKINLQTAAVLPKVHKCNSGQVKVSKQQNADETAPRVVRQKCL